MFMINDTLVSEDILEKQFVCDLSRCKGACCVEGDAGAPLSVEEAGILQEEYQNFKPYLRKEGIKAVEEQGTSVTDPHDGEDVTPLVNGAECAYVIFDENGISKCGIEKAWEEGGTTFRKPVSCHLYPVRVNKYVTYEAVNYHKWEICSPACELGEQLKVPVYRFLKEALIRKYGPEWYHELDEVARYWTHSQKKR